MLLAIIFCTVIRLPTLIPRGLLLTFITDPRGLTAVFSSVLGAALVPSIVIIFLYIGSFKKMGKIKSLHVAEVVFVMVMISSVGLLIYGNRWGAVIAPVGLTMLFLGIILRAFSWKGSK
jgi:hypothetical protein